MIAGVTLRLQQTDPNMKSSSQSTAIQSSF